MKLKNIFVSDNLGTEKVLVSTNDNIFSGLIRCNETASFIIDCLSVDITVDEIVDKVIKRYNVDKQKARCSVQKIISQLKEINVLEDSKPPVNTVLF